MNGVAQACFRYADERGGIRPKRNMSIALDITPFFSSQEAGIRWLKRKPADRLENILLSSLLSQK